MTLSALRRSLSRHILLLALLTASVAALGWYLSWSSPPTYRATALVRVQAAVRTPAEAFGSLQAGGRLAQTYVQVARTLPIAESIARSLGGRVPLAEIAGNLEAQQPDGLDLVSISATSHDPRTAYAVASQAPAALQQFVARTSASGDSITLVARPTMPTKPFAPRPLSALLVAALLGLALNASLLLIVDLVADRAVDGRRLDEIAGARVIARIPRLRLVRVVPRG